jgi:hypothetical protein
MTKSTVPQVDSLVTVSAGVASAPNALSAANAISDIENSRISHMHRRSVSLTINLCSLDYRWIWAIFSGMATLATVGTEWVISILWIWFPIAVHLLTVTIISLVTYLATLKAPSFEFGILLSSNLQSSSC